ncbi:hypothetical protein [Synechocystis sp. PCC 7509]|nr:hypothetical protein [Synechocystis sp. PCC 7509]
MTLYCFPSLRGFCITFLYCQEPTIKVDTELNLGDRANQPTFVLDR